MKFWGRVLMYAVSSIIAVLVVVLAIIGTMFLVSQESHAREPATVKVIGTPSALRIDKYYDDVRQPVYVVESTQDKTPAQGSGVMVAKGKMLTAKHVVGNDMVVIVGDRKIPAKLIRQHERLDIALLEVDLDCPCAVISKQPTPVDERLLVVGFPLGKLIGVKIVSEGRMQGTYDGALLMTASVANGSSGGGVFARRGEWQLIGIVTAFVGPGGIPVQSAALTIAVPADSMGDL
jgi:S1-C subfamily serine protease